MVEHRTWPRVVLCCALAGCSDPSLQAIVEGPRPTVASCYDGRLNAAETDVDCGGPSCRLCSVGQSCNVDSDCEAACVDHRCWVARTCNELHLQRASLATGVYPATPSGVSAAAFPVLCEMSMAGGGWTRVAFDPAGSGGEGVEGALTYLAAPSGNSDSVARGTGGATIGVLFAHLYRELMITWNAPDQQFIRFTPSREIFQNDIDLQLPVSDFATSHASLNEWVLDAGGAMFCRASQFRDVRPGDTSWAVKPVNSVGSACGCNDLTWADRGAFYGGGIPNTSCTLRRGGGWSGVKDIGAIKAGLSTSSDLSLWVR